MSSTLLLTIACIIGAYLIGSISSAILICRLRRLPDPRSTGSKNPGATNVLRIAGPQVAAWVLICDLLKGTIPVWLSYKLGLPPLAIAIIGLCAVFGHIFPLYFHFQGGKGVATAFGTLLPLGMDMAGAMLITWLITLALFGYSSLAALVAAVLAPLYVWLLKPEYTIAVAMLSLLVIVSHHDNIQRLFHKQEKRIWRPKLRLGDDEEDKPS